MDADSVSLTTGIPRILSFATNIKDLWVDARERGVSGCCSLFCLDCLFGSGALIIEMIGASRLQ
jgi:hypothetical protein